MNANRVIDTIGNWEGYTLEEAVSLINLHVVRKADMVGRDEPRIDDLGYIAGVISLNEEIELLIKFSDELLQLPKQHVSLLVHILPDDDDL